MPNNNIERQAKLALHNYNYYNTKEQHLIKQIQELAKKNNYTLHPVGDWPYTRDDIQRLTANDNTAQQLFNQHKAYRTNRLDATMKYEQLTKNMTEPEKENIEKSFAQEQANASAARDDIKKFGNNVANAVDTVVNAIPNSTYESIGKTAMQEQDPNKAAANRQAQLQENFAAQMNANAAQNRQIVNRDERQEAAKDAVAKSAATNSQKVANLGAAAGTGAAALARETVSPDINTLRERQDVQRQKAIENEKAAYDLNELAIRKRSKAEDTQRYNTQVDEQNQRAYDLSLGKTNATTKSLVEDINQYLHDYKKIEQLPPEKKQEVKKQLILNIIDMQNALNTHHPTNKYVTRYTFANNKVSPIDTTKQQLENDYAQRAEALWNKYLAENGNDANAAYKKMAADRISMFQSLKKPDGSSLTPDGTAPDPKDTADYLTRYYNDTSSLNSNVTNTLASAGQY